ncbi:MAG: hypothetical protein ABIX37_10555 [Gammaproteobacteria bacterium]
MFSRALTLMVLAGFLGLTGCDNGSNASNGAAGPVNFDSFAKSTLSEDESSEPREVNDVDFEFDDNPGAYDAIVD